MARHVVIHGHFYQPPRENPFFGRVPREPSAAPFHDWNQRIASECYAPLSRARILDAEGREVERFNCYEAMSWNVGPTLLSWMATEAKEIHATLVAADRATRGGMAQAHGHIILPLATRRDKETEVRWGLADFRHRFGREATGMWLPETACDTETLEVLAAEGVAFTVLSPRQVRRVRKRGAARFVDVTPSRLDTRAPFDVRLPSGRSIVAFVYDGQLANDVAFGGLLHSADELVDHVLSKFSGAGDELVHLAVDGETFGHHHRWGDMALARALSRLSREEGVHVTSYAERHEAMVPVYECELVEPSSWSCPHGVGRWSRDCGCRFREGSSQAWRAPLRAAMDGLRDEIQGAVLSRWPDAFEARDRYIEDKLGRRGPWTPRERTLLEVLDHALAMYTSCGWFFDDADRIEGTIVLLHAERAIDLLWELGIEVGRAFEVALSRISTGRGTLLEHVRASSAAARSTPPSIRPPPPPSR